MTSKVSEWELSETSFADQEDSMTDFRGEVNNRETIARVQRIINYTSIGEEDAVEFTDDEHFFNTLKT